MNSMQNQNKKVFSDQSQFSEILWIYQTSDVGVIESEYVNIELILKYTND